VAPIPIIDAHIHLFDRRRPQGVAWPPKDDPAPGITALPPRYRELVKPFGVVGAIVEEASPWLEDNQWVLDQIATDSIFVGTVGFLDPGERDFGKNLERFRKNKRVDGRVPTDPNFYREWLEQLWSIFGENRVMFGSDWPNSEHVGQYSDVMTKVDSTRYLFTGRRRRLGGKRLCRSWQYAIVILRATTPSGPPMKRFQFEAARSAGREPEEMRDVWLCSTPSGRSTGAADPFPATCPACSAPRTASPG
jgi:predicted TIM-barrel fold metal-dependent hydrolase